jgi:hypothetical protein
MGPAPLPGGPRKARPDRLDEARVGIGGDQAHPAQPSGDQASEEGEPPRPVLSRGHLSPEDLPAPLGVHARGDEHMHPHGSPALADLHDQGIRPHEAVGALVERTGAERLDEAVELLGHLRHLGLGKSRDPQRLGQAHQAPRRDPEQVVGGHHRGESRLGPLAALKQPVGEVASAP